VRKSEGKRPLRRSRCRWENSNKIYLREIISDGMDRIKVAQDRDQWRGLVNAVINLPVP
jgi:hypothetical protein